MARGLRDKAAGIFHVYTRAAKSDDVFRDDLDRVVFLRELARAQKEAAWRCIAYCVMTTHYHLLLEVDDNALPLGMQALNFRYAMAFNARHGTRGHVFGRRYDARRISDQAHLMIVYRYLALNPVKAHVCAEPASWTWSSYAGAIGVVEPATFVASSRILDCFGGAPALAQRRLRAFVELP
jgi:REP element-mobilizing transposase RayT